MTFSSRAGPDTVCANAFASLHYPANDSLVGGSLSRENDQRFSANSVSGAAMPVGGCFAVISQHFWKAETQKQT
jgi:hypothetical protein